MTPEQILTLARDLRSLGVRSFKGGGVELEFGPEQGAAAQQRTVEIPGLGEVDPDLLGDFGGATT